MWRATEQAFQFVGGIVSVLIAVFYSTALSVPGERWLKGRALYFDALSDWILFNMTGRVVSYFLPARASAIRAVTYAGVRDFARDTARYRSWRASLAGERRPALKVLGIALMYLVFYLLARIIPVPRLLWFQTRIMLLVLYVPAIIATLPLFSATFAHKYSIVRTNGVLPRLLCGGYSPLYSAISRLSLPRLAGC